jgi:hypothetical protein
MNRLKISLKPTLYSILSFILMLLFYFSVISIFESFTYAVRKFQTSGVLILLLSLGFAVQIFLHVYMNQIAKLKGGKLATATSGITSGTAMVFCCLHHITDLLPVVGISIFGLLSPSFETIWMTIGLSINLIAILFLLGHMKKHQAYTEGSLFKVVNYMPIKLCVIGISIMTIIVIYFAL